MRRSSTVSDSVSPEAALPAGNTAMLARTRPCASTISRARARRTGNSPCAKAGRNCCASPAASSTRFTAVSANRPARVFMCCSSTKVGVLSRSAGTAHAIVANMANAQPTASSSAATSSSSAAVPNSETITLADGRTLCFARYGATDGRPVIYLHGAGSSRIEGGLYDQQARAVGVQIIATDRPGCGGSSPAPGRTFPGYALDLQELADALGIKRFVVAGMSNGGVYAMAAAARLPDRITTAIPINTSTPLHDPVARQATPLRIRLTYALVRHAVPVTMWSLKHFANSAKVN